VVDRVRYKLAATVHRCLHNKAPKYLTVCCVAVSDIAGRQWLRSAHRRQLDVPRYRRTTLGRRAFSVAGPTSGFRFQTCLEKRLKTISGCHWKHRFSDNISVVSALEILYDNALYRSTFYLLTYVGLMCCLLYRRTSGAPVQRPFMSPARRRACPARGVGRSYLAHSCTGRDVLSRDTEERQRALAIPRHCETDVRSTVSLRNRQPRAGHLHVPYYTVQQRRIRTGCLVNHVRNQLTYCILATIQPFSLFSSLCIATFSANTLINVLKTGYTYTELLYRL